MITAAFEAMHIQKCSQIKCPNMCLSKVVSFKTFIYTISINMVPLMLHNNQIECINFNILIITLPMKI